MKKETYRKSERLRKSKTQKFTKIIASFSSRIRPPNFIFRAIIGNGEDVKKPIESLKSMIDRKNITK